MKTLDRVLQRWRIAVAGRHIPEGSRVLDVGSFDGTLFRQLGRRLSEGVGIDPLIDTAIREGHFCLLPGRFPDALPDDEPPFDVIAMLAVLEHIPAHEVDAVAAECADRLKPGGRLIITVPSPLVDVILAVLRFLRLIHGMSLEEHCGFRPSRTPGIFSGAGLIPIVERRFQLGLNHLFVFEKSVER